MAETPKRQYREFKKSKVEFYTLKIRIIWLRDLLDEATEYVFDHIKAGGRAKNLYERIGRLLADQTIDKTTMKQISDWRMEDDMHQAINCNNCKHKADVSKPNLFCETCIRFNSALTDKWEPKQF